MNPPGKNGGGIPGKKKTITIDIDTDAKITVETDGFVGTECAQATRAIERALGLQTSEELKPEYHRRPTTNRLTAKR